MIDPKQINDLVNRLTNAIPPEVRNLYKDLEKNLYSIVQSGLAKLDLVSREEFDAQKRVLQQTRKKLDALEKKINEKTIKKSTKK